MESSAKTTITPDAFSPPRTAANSGRVPAKNDAISGPWPAIPSGQSSRRSFSHVEASSGTAWRIRICTPSTLDVCVVFAGPLFPGFALNSGPALDQASIDSKQVENATDGGVHHVVDRARAAVERGHRGKNNHA